MSFRRLSNRAINMAINDKAPRQAPIPFVSFVATFVPFVVVVHRTITGRYARLPTRTIPLTGAVASPSNIAYATTV